MTVSPRIAAERQARYDSRMARAAEVVPDGMYCYRVTGEPQERRMPDGTTRTVLPTQSCPYWKQHGGKGRQRDGYCRLLKAGDWMPHPHGTMLLWDQVKECHINDDLEEIEDDPGEAQQAAA